MRIMILGAGGFVGRHIMAELLAEGHDIVAVVRKSGDLPAAFPQVRFVALDLALETDEQAWLDRLAGTGCVVNSAGILRGRQMDAIHVDMPRALYAAAGKAGVKQVVLVSAISARADVTTDYSLSKLAGEAALRESGIGWTILRPSLIYGDGSYGGTSLMRGLASMPFAVPIPAKGEYSFSPIHVRDLARSVALICGNKTFHGQSLEPVGPETCSLRDLLGRYRAWLGFGRARFVSIPLVLMKLLGRLGDIAGSGPVSTNSLAQLMAGNAGDGASFEKAIGFAPRDMDAALLARPAQVQDRWHARLYFLAPAIKAVLIILWLTSAYLGLFHGTEAANALTARLGMPQNWADVLRVGGSILDIAVAALVLWDMRARWSTFVQLAMVLGYSGVIGMAMPELWLDPLGPLLKNLPILLLIAVHGAIGNRR